MVQLVRYRGRIQTQVEVTLEPVHVLTLQKLVQALESPGPVGVGPLGVAHLW